VIFLIPVMFYGFEKFAVRRESAPERQWQLAVSPTLRETAEPGLGSAVSV